MGNRLKKKYGIGIIILLGIIIFVLFYQNDFNKTDLIKENPNQKFENKSVDKIIFWNKARPLTYDDFQGIINRDVKNDQAAVSTIGFELPTTFDTLITNTEMCQYEIKNYTVIARFDKSLSWMNLERIKQTNLYVETLNHEQRHFDIAEIYSRVLMNIINTEFKNKKFICSDIDNVDLKSSVVNDARTKINSLESMIAIEYHKSQSSYENEAGYDIFSEQQKKWDVKIDECLAMDLREIRQCLYLYSK